MTAKEYFSQITVIPEIINSYEMEKADLKQKAYEITGQRFDKVCVKSSHSNEPSYVRIINRITEIDKQIEEENRKLENAEKVISEFLNGLDEPTEKAVIRLRYFNGLSFSEISRRINVSRRTAYRLHDTALGKFSNNI